MTTAQTSEANSIPGAHLLLEQMVRLNDNVLVSVDHLQQKSRAYLSVGALAVAAGVAFLTVPATVAEAEPAFRNGVIAGASLALLLFGLSAVYAVRAERATRLPDAPSAASLAALVGDEEHQWSNDQLALWTALEFIDAVTPAAEETVDKIARLVDRQLVLFLVEIGVLGGTLIAALLA
ncbi:MAG: hypothetical protein OXE43_10980 [Chloroflexi bacterium]|nr:hypothetical protein [Chloroflexota bacterium]